MQQATLTPEKLIYPQAFVRKEFNVSAPTWWRWKKAEIIPTPDVHINGKDYYSAQKRCEIISAILGKEAQQ